MKLNTGTSIVDRLKSMGKGASFADRTKLAAEKGIEGYQGTADQNNQLLKSLGTDLQEEVKTGTTNKKEPTYSEMIKDGLEEPEKKDYKSELMVERDNAKAKMDEVFGKSKGARTNTFNTEYTNRGLGESKKRISSLDTEINRIKQERDDALAKASNNPSLSMASLTGQRGKLLQGYNDRLTNLISERNAIADEYNTGLSEVEKLATLSAGDTESELAYYTSLLNRADTDLSNYDKLLIEQLKDEREQARDMQSQANWEREMAQALTIARMKEANSGAASKPDDWEMVRDEYTNDPLYWYNPKTKAIEYINKPMSADGASTPSTQDFGVVQEEKAPGFWQRIFGGGN